MGCKQISSAEEMEKEKILNSSVSNRHPDDFDHKQEEINCTSFTQIMDFHKLWYKIIFGSDRRLFLICYNLQ